MNSNVQPNQADRSYFHLIAKLLEFKVREMSIALLYIKIHHSFMRTILYSGLALQRTKLHYPLYKLRFTTQKNKTMGLALQKATSSSVRPSIYNTQNCTTTLYSGLDLQHTKLHHLACVTKHKNTLSWVRA